MRILGGTRIPGPGRRRWMIPLIAVASLCVLVAIALLVVYPRVGASKVREKVTAKLGGKLGREVRMGEVDVSLGRAVIHNLEIRGPNDGELPLVHVDRIEIAFDAMASLVGSVKLGDAIVEGVVVSVRRNSDGRDNVSDVIARVRADREKPGSGDGGGGSSLPTSISVTRAKLLADDAQAGATMIVNDGIATWKPGELIAEARGISATTIAAPRAGASKLVVRKTQGEPPSVTVEGGEVSLWEKFSLTGIAGNVTADPSRPGQYTLAFAGGYGGVPGNLWTAKGALDPQALAASLDIVAEKFKLERLAPILKSTPVVDYATTSVDTKIKLDMDRNGVKFAGELHLTGLNVGHPLIADKEVHDLDLQANVAGVFDRKNAKLSLEQGDFVARDVPFSVTGFIARPPKQAAVVVQPDPDAKSPGKQIETVARRGPGGIQLLSLRLVIPPIDCQRVLNAIPTEMAPYLAGYKLKGTFDTDVHLEIDWDNLDATKLGGQVGLRKCKVKDEPADSPKRLLEEFEHYVEVEKDKWHSFVVGPSNEDFVPIDQISPYLIKSIMSTEDSAFYHHKGFITSEFRTALVSDLKAGRFRHGASSITMQMVKNVLLYREKTLARKLQELFLTWHVENTLEKDRILEIYFNVIEYGPGLYGIGPATKHYFGKPPKDLNPVEAAFFSTILPSPKERYKQFCAGTLSKWTDDKIKRILGIMKKRERLTAFEYDLAMVTPLVFVKNETETEEQCLKRVKTAIKNARPTNPLKK